MDIKTLLEECEQLDHNGRMQRMIQLGQTSINNASDKAIIQGLLEGSLYEQILGLQTCHGSRNVQPALQALSSTSQILRTRALPFILMLGTDEEALEALKLCPLHLQAVFLHRLRKQQRVSVIDAFLLQLGSSKTDKDLFQFVLPYASEKLVKKHLVKAPKQISYKVWRKLIQYHPRIACVAIHEWAERTKSYDAAFERVADELLGQNGLPESLWDTVYDVARLMVKSHPSKKVSLGTLYKRPSQAFDQLAFDAYEQGPFSLDWKVANKLPTKVLLRLFNLYPSILTQKNFERLRPEKRSAIYSVIPQGWRNDDGVLREDTIGALPSEDRVYEAQKHIKLPIYELKPFLRIPYVAFLPWEEAMPMQNAFIRSNDAEIRGLALKVQIKAAQYQHSHYGDALQLVVPRKFEQDPVRCQMLQGLARLSPTHWKEEHLPGLTGVVRDALDASDLSYASEKALNNLVVPLLSVHPTWAAPQLASILREREQIPRELHISGKTPIKETMRLLAEALLPTLKYWQARGKDTELLCLARALEFHIRHFPDLLNILEQILERSPGQSGAEITLRLFTKHDPRRLDLLVPRLLKKDPSYVVFEAVYRQIHCRQQNLITPYLDSNAPEGCFVNGRRARLHWILNGYYRWTLKQQERLGKTLTAMIGDQKSPTIDPKQRIRQLESLCFLDASYLAPFTNDDRPAIGDFALRAMSRLDAGQGVPTLLEALHTDKARIAIYALRSTFRTMPRSTIFEHLKAAPLGKVTVAKEVIRSIGELRTEEAYQYLLEKDKSDLHRDARTALLKALWLYPERAETWEILRKAAQDPNPPIPKTLAQLPTDGLSPQEEESAVKILALLLSHPLAEVRIETLNHCMKTSDPSQHLSGRLLALLESPIEDEARTALKAIYNVYKETSPALIARAFEVLLLNPSKRRVLTNRGCSYLSHQLSIHRQHTFPITLSILRVLEKHPLTLRMRLIYTFKTLPWSEFRAEFDNLAPFLHADALVGCEHHIENELANRADARLEELESDFGASGDERLRRLGLAALVALSKKPKGWTDETRGKLENYRKDESVLVQEAAVDVFPPVILKEASKEGGR
ncbi:MAG: hypothetical protein M1835_000674 [Candelina submexicana]|nr:MAG: hypothetical protein M1835_000674 [Candelina submexicana]